MIAARVFLITGDEKFLPEIAQRHKTLHEQIQQLRKGFLSKKERDLLAEIERAEQEHQRATEEAIALKLGGEPAGMFAEKVEPAREALERRLSAYILHERQILEQTDLASTRKTSFASVLILISGLLAVGLTVILAILLTRRLALLYDFERRERRVAESARHRYRDLVEGIPGGIVWEADALTLRMNFVSRRAEEMLGYTLDASSSDPNFWTLLIPVEDRERVLALAARALQDGTEQQFEHRFLATDGRVVWFQTRIHRREEEGKLPVLRGLSVDVTRLREADEALRLRARQQAAVVRLGQEALTETDLARLFQSACRLAAETLQADFAAVLQLSADRGEFLVRAGTGWKDGVVGTAIVGAETSTQAGYTLLAGEPVIVPDVAREERFEQEPLLREHGVAGGLSVVIPGAEAPAGVLAVHTRKPRRFVGEDAYFLQSVANVLSAVMGRRLADQAVQESERRKAAILVGALDAIITIDFEGRILEFNPAAEGMFGRVEDDVRGREMAEMIMPERFRDRHREGMERYLVTGEGRILNRRLEMTALRSDGSEFPIELTITQISGEGPPVFCGFARDITDRKRSEAERTDLLAREQRARLVAEDAESRAAFLAEASAALASSLDYRTTLASVARLMVPRIADGCAVDMLDGEGRLRRLTTSHSDPSRIAFSEEVARRYPLDLRALHGAGHVVATGQPEILTDFSDEVLRATARDE
jgi:PAS domain S-box-containing protein